MGGYLLLGDLLAFDRAGEHQVPNPCPDSHSGRFSIFCLGSIRSSVVIAATG